jgi:hypothetical protein
MKFRIFVILVVMFAGVLAVNAQMDECMGLDADTCSMVSMAGDNLAESGSFGFDMAMSLEVTGMGAMDPTAGDVFVDITGSGVIAYDMSQTFPADMSFDAEIVATMGDETQEMTISVAIVDDVLYASSSEDPEVTQLPIELALAQAGITPDMLAGMMAGGEADADMMASYGMLAGIEGFISQEVLAVEDGETPILTTLDFSALLNDPAFADELTKMTSGSGDPQMAMVAQVLPAIDAGMTVTRYVNADQILSGVSVEFGLEFDMGAMMGADGMPPIEVNMTLDVEMYDFGADFDIQPLG